MPALLEVDGVSKSFGGVAANVDISFDVAAGEMLGLIGPNGAGKTSLFNAIAGEVAPDAGEIRLDGARISGLGPVACAARGVARTFQVVRALATGPRLILLDEMLTGLTPTEAQEGVALVRAVQGRGITVIMVEHVMEVVLPLVSRVVVLDLGRVLTIGAPADIVRHPGVIRAYLGDKYAPAA